MFPTKAVVKNFGSISMDNKHIITMEWIIEGVSLIFIGIILFLITIINMNNPVSIAMYWLIIVMLNTLSVISLFTGFKVNFLPYKLCPIIFTSASILIIIGLMIK